MKSAREAQLVPIRMPTVCWKTRPPDIANISSMITLSMMMPVSECSFFFFFFLQNKICIYVDNFYETKLNILFESVFKFRVGNSYVEKKKIVKNGTIA